VLAAGRVDFLVNNAATAEPLGPAISIATAELRPAFEVNVIAPAALTAAFLPGMLEAGWGRVVNVSSGIVASPAGMVRGNAYAATKAALEAHTVNLAAELAGTGVTVNVYRPGGVDTAMQAWIRSQDPGRVGALHERFNRNYSAGTLITPAQSAVRLLARLGGEDTGGHLGRQHCPRTSLRREPGRAPRPGRARSGQAVRRPAALAPTLSNALLVTSRIRPADRAGRSAVCQYTTGDGLNTRTSSTPAR
jgi:NAD(P)-dependent dehydrogenase (short-subunit alcohol dehydrogenase family)